MNKIMITMAGLLVSASMVFGASVVESHQFPYLVREINYALEDATNDTHTVNGKSTLNGELEVNSAVIDLNLTKTNDIIDIVQTNVAGTPTIPLIKITDGRTGTTADTAGEAALVIDAEGAYGLAVVDGILQVEAEIDTPSGDLTLDPTGNNVIVDGNMKVSGIYTGSLAGGSSLPISVAITPQLVSGKLATTNATGATVTPQTEIPAVTVTIQTETPAVTVTKQYDTPAVTMTPQAEIPVVTVVLQTVDLTNHYGLTWMWSPVLTNANFYVTNEFQVVTNVTWTEVVFTAVTNATATIAVPYMTNATFAAFSPFMTNASAAIAVPYMTNVVVLPILTATTESVITNATAAATNP